MVSKIEAVWKQVLQTFVRQKSGPLQYDQEKIAVLKKLLDSLKRDDVALDVSLLQREPPPHPIPAWVPTSAPAPVTYIEVCACPTATLEIFVLHSGRRMPLHDHPHMVGLLKVIAGTVHIDSYTVVSRQENQPDGRTVLLAKKQTSVVCEDDPSCILTPSDKNLHAINSVAGMAAFLDILSPPYHCDIPGCTPNPCNFYKEAGSVDGPNGEVLVKLVETPMPNEYWCDVAPYKGPAVNDRATSDFMLRREHNDSCSCCNHESSAPS